MEKEFNYTIIVVNADKSDSAYGKGFFDSWSIELVQEILKPVQDTYPNDNLEVIILDNRSKTRISYHKNEIDKLVENKGTNKTMRVTVKANNLQLEAILTPSEYTRYKKLSRTGKENMLMNRGKLIYTSLEIHPRAIIKIIH